MSHDADTLVAPAGLLRASPPLWLYGLVVFAGAWLVFWIQPLAVRGILPVLGVVCHIVPLEPHGI